MGLLAGVVDGKEILQKTKDHVRSLTWGEGTGHDWFHMERVLTLSEMIAEEESVTAPLLPMVALLHDLDDEKVSRQGSCRSRAWMEERGMVPGEVEYILACIDEVSFSKNGNKSPDRIEAAVVQDADRLDALGAIGIARCFAFGGSRGRMIYDPSDLVELQTSQETYVGKGQSSVAHFYAKLLRLRGTMNTATGRRLATERHAYLEDFLNHFFLEWNPKNL